MTLPTGEQLLLAHGDQRAIVTEVGATLREYERAGVPVIEGFDESEMATGARGQLCFPWPNRLGTGSWCFSGREARAPLDEPEHGNAVHGLVRYRPFRVDAVAQNRVALSLLVHPEPGYPFLALVEVAYHLGAMGLTVTTTVTNADTVALPFGLGFHPYLAVPAHGVDRAILSVPACGAVPVDEHRRPSTPARTLDAALDWREPRTIDGAALDVTLCDLVRDDSGWATARLAEEDTGAVELSVDRTFPYFQVFTGDTLHGSRRRTAVSVEPMTCPPDALRTGKDLVVLEPGQRWTGSWRVRRR
ncbi:MAG TPA: aldose 1-epimerase family protein [Acidimicrobiales bacterium]|jgi:aldose 1-epimerase|nr:aldose 1-epimerase family protein [Acidimicrobiales bacterium]